MLLVMIGLSVLLGACKAQQAAVATPDGTERPIAFPGAEGFGRYATGGRGGRVVVVTTLQDGGPGSLREALNVKGPRIIVFAVSGTIHLNAPLSVKAHTTLAGQTAPGDGICLADHPVTLGGDNIIIRYLRFRMGDRYQNGGKVHGSGTDDALGGTRRKHIIIDHCSMSWSTDEAFSIYAGDSTTLQWNLVAEPLNYSYHFETGDTDFQRHGYGGILGGRHISIHHNLYAHCQSRTPRFDGNRNIAPDTEQADFRNNVLYNWGSNNVYGGEGGRYNIVGNYYKSGPSTGSSVRYRVANPFKGAAGLDYGRYYIIGNFMADAPAVTADNWQGVTMDKGSAADAGRARMSAPFATDHIATQAAETAYAAVLNGAGASFRRDTLDQRIVADVRHRTGRIIDVQGGFPHGTPYAQTVGAWPLLKALPALPDGDGDGMPDEWERARGLDRSDAFDAAKKSLHPFYTNIEIYINSLL